MGVAEQLITDMKTNATTAMQAAMGKAGQITSAAASASPGGAGVVNVPTLPAMPTAPIATNMQGTFSTALNQAQAVVDSLQNSWLTKYFPAALPNGIDTFLAQVTNGLIVTATQQEIAWERARGQVVRDARRASDEAVNNWASRGFSLPGGVVNNQLAMISQQLLDKNAELAAAQAAKAIDIQVDATKFAAEISTKLRLGLIEALTGLVTAYSKLPGTAAEYASAVAHANTAMYQTVAEYYKTAVAGAEITLKAEVANAEQQTRAMAVLGDYYGKLAAVRVQAYTAEADVYARAAAAAMSGMHAVASTNTTTMN